jgi:hypothetical protein
MSEVNVLVNNVNDLENQNNENNENNENNAEGRSEEYKKMSEKKFWGYGQTKWGYVSTFTNGLSVVLQLQKLLKTFKAQDFDMRFISLMVLLNGWYFVVACLEANIGYALATLAFVIYNLIVIYIHYCGVGSSSSAWFCRK